MEMKEEHFWLEEKVESHLYKIGMFAQMNHVTVNLPHFYKWGRFTHWDMA